MKPSPAEFLNWFAKTLYSIVKLSEPTHRYWQSHNSKSSVSLVLFGISPYWLVQKSEPSAGKNTFVCEGSENQASVFVPPLGSNSWIWCLRSLHALHNQSTKCSLSYSKLCTSVYFPPICLEMLCVSRLIFFHFIYVFVVYGRTDFRILNWFMEMHTGVVMR